MESGYLFRYGDKSDPKFLAKVWQLEQEVAKYLNIHYVLAEIDDSLTLDPEDVKKKITPRTRAIMLVHMLGNPGRLDEIKKIADKNYLFLIEDSAQAFGSTYKEKKPGSIGDFGTYSFNIFKTITAGDGGMVASVLLVQLY